MSINYELYDDYILNSKVQTVEQVTRDVHKTE